MVPKRISNRFAKYFAGVGKCFAEKNSQTNKKYYIVFETPAIKQSKSFPNPNLRGQIEMNSHCSSC